MENVFVYLAQFRRAAKRADWPKERIDAVLDDAMSSDYTHALEVVWEAMAEIEEETEKIESIRF